MPNYRNITLNVKTLELSFGMNNCSDTFEGPFLTFDFQEVSELNAYKAFVFALPNLKNDDNQQSFISSMRELCRDYHVEEYPNIKPT